MDPGRFRVTVEGLNQALDNHGTFTALVPDWLWDGYKDAKTYTRYRVLKFGKETVSYIDDGRKRRCEMVVAHVETVFSAHEGNEDEVFAMPVEYLFDENASVDFRAVNPLPPHPDHIAVERAYHVANYPENIKDDDIIVTLDLFGRNLEGILSTKKWKPHQIYVMEMNPAHATYMRLNGVPNVTYTENGFEDYVISKKFDRIRHRVRVVYADYYGGIGSNLVNALETLPRLSSYAVNACARRHGKTVAKFAVDGRLDGFKKVSSVSYGGAMICHMFGRSTERNYYRV